MGHVSVEAEAVDLESPTFVEGLPGAGLVGKIAADHLVETYGMDYYGSVRCEGFPEVAVYQNNDSRLRPPVRLYADAERDLVVLQSDVPVSPREADDFAACVVDWLDANVERPVFLSGLPVEEKGDTPELWGTYTGEGKAWLDDAGVVPPTDGGLISGPTGALLHRAGETDSASVGLIVECNAQFPDPEAARVLLKHGVEPLAGVEVEVDELVDHAEEIRQAREELARRMQEAGEESSQAQSTRMFQ